MKSYALQDKAARVTSGTERSSPKTGYHEHFRQYENNLPEIRHILRQPVLQPKYLISKPEDPLEEEADRVAETVLRMPEGKPTGRKTNDITANPQANTYIFRTPDANPTDQKKKTEKEKEKESALPPDKVRWVWKDLLLYPFIVDVYRDIISKKITPKERKELGLKGHESAAFYAWLWAGLLPLGGLGGPKYEKGFTEGLSLWSDYTNALEPLLPGSSSVFVDGFSRIVGLRLDDYLGSERFKLRCKEHIASIVALALLVQGGYSTIVALKDPGAEKGDFEPTQWSKQIALGTWLLGKIFKEELKGPDFFNLGPLKTSIHPAFATDTFMGGEPPGGVALEQKRGFGEGEGGEESKFSLTLNLPKIFNGDASAKDMGDLGKYRGWQTSLWFGYDKFIPTLTMKTTGRIPEEKIRGGTIFGGGGHLFLLEAGGRYTGEEAAALTSWFIKGGYGFGGPKDSILRKIGFTAVLTDWQEKDSYAPVGATGMGESGMAGMITPFARLELGRSLFGNRHRLEIGGALSLVMGSKERFDISGFRGDLSYTFLGNSSPEGLPVFKIDLSGSLHRLDWWNPNSPWLWEVQNKVMLNKWFMGWQLMGGADKIPDSRARLMGESDKVRVPTSFLIVGGYIF